MFTPVEIPLWMVVLGALLCLIALLDRLLIPSVRWYLRRRFNHAIERLNQRLDLKIPPFKLTSRAVLIDRLAHDPEVMEAAFVHAQEQGLPVDVARAQAMRYARETVPSFSAFAYFSFGIRVARWLSQSLYRVRLGRDAEDLHDIAPDATVVFVMNHRSNMDYVLVTYLAAERSALSYAVGEWARVWPLQTLIRASGAYFIRRRSRNALYRKVLARYVQMATEGGVTQAVFIEGGLSRDGTVGTPKMGLLSYILEGFDPLKGRDVVFVPVGLNYDRVLEDRILIAAQGVERPRFRPSIPDAVARVARHFWLRITGRFHKYGYASVSFGTPVSLRSLAQQGKIDVKALAHRLTDDIRAAIPILPVSLVASLMRQHRSITRAGLKTEAEAKIARMTARGAHWHIPRGDMDYGLEFGLRLLIERGILRESEGIVSVVEAELPLIDYYAAAIAHFDRGGQALREAGE